MAYEPKMARKKSNDAMKRRKKKLLKCLEEEYGGVIAACKKAKIDKGTFYNYYHSDPEFADACDDIKDGVIQQVETSMLKKAIDGKDTLAQIFVLKSKGGWQETKKIEITQNQKLIEITPAFNPKELEEAKTLELPEAEIVEETKPSDENSV